MGGEAAHKHRKHTAAWVITAAVFALAAAGYLLDVFDYLERKTYDFRVRALAGSSRPSEDIIVVLVDQDSIEWARRERGWSWPWPRAAYGEIVAYMRDAGARSIAFDVLLSEPSVYGPADDGAFAQADAAFGRTVHTVFFSTQWGSTRAWPPALKTPLFHLSGFESLLRKGGAFALEKGEKEKRIGAQFPVPALMDSAGAIGNVTSFIDADSVIRRSRLFTLFDGRAVPGLSAASLLVSGAGEELRYDGGKGEIRWEDFAIPVDSEGGTLLRFKGESLDRYFPYGAATVLQSAEAYRSGGAPPLPPEDFAGKYVFFGYYAPGLLDICSTPLSSVYPGFGIHITMLDNILSRDFIRRCPLFFDLVLICALPAAAVALTFFVSSIPVAVGGFLLAIALLTGGAFLAYAGGWWIPFVAPAAAAFLGFLTAALYNYATEGSQKRFITSAFSQYLSPVVIQQLVANPEKLSLGGERRELSIFFSDIEGFTSISEGLDPARLTELLNEYLSFMTAIILDSGGTIDKYEGDAIIAFWNAPLAYPDHAARALRASLDCQEELLKRQGFFQEKYGCRLPTRIGLNTGQAVVGNMGSSKRFDYTMLGDAVNLAARLEGLNKQFGTYLMCTQATMEAARSAGAFWGRKLAQVAVVGKTEPVVVYEPSAAPGDWKNFDAARDLFYAARFAEALRAFEALAAEDPPAYFYAAQCRHYLAHPAEWKGFWQALRK